MGPIPDIKRIVARMEAEAQAAKREEAEEAERAREAAEKCKYTIHIKERLPEKIEPCRDCGEPAERVYLFMKFSGPVHLETTKLFADRYTWLCNKCHSAIIQKGGFIQ